MADEYDGYTFVVGHVHVLTERGGACVEKCPHPDHALSPGKEGQ